MKIFDKIQQVEKLSPGLKSLYLHQVIRGVGVGLIGMFGPIFLYVLSGSIEFVLIFFGLIYLSSLLFIPLWAKILKFFSLHIFMFAGIVFLIIYFILFYFLAEAGGVIMWLVVLLILVTTLERVFYWVPYHVDFVRFVDKHHKGRQLSFLGIVISIISIFIPIFSAFIIAKFGFSVLFILAAVLVVVSLVPLYFIPHTRESYSFGYFETFKKLFSKKHLKTNLSYVADGFQSTIGAIFWPIFIFLILKGEYLEIGLISAAVVLVTCILRYIIGEATDRFDKKKLIKTGNIFYSLGWIFKALSVSGWHIFFVGIYHDFTSIIVRTPFDTLMYEIAADEGHYVDEFTVLREMALRIGRVILLILALILLNFMSIAWIFVLGAMVSLLMNLINKEEFYLASHK